MTEGPDPGAIPRTTEVPEDAAVTAAQASDSRAGFLNAAFWSFISGSGRQVLKVGITFVLAAILGPEVYGLAAMALVFVLFIDMLQQQGMAAALIQRKQLTRSHLDTAFWLLLATSVVLIGASVAVSGWWADVNGVPALKGVIIALTPMIPLQGLSIVQDALLRRRMAFKDLAKRELVAVTSGGLIGVAGALVGWGVWALVAQQIAVATVGVIVLWTVNDWRPGWHISRSAAKDLMTFSSGLLLSSIGNFVNNQADTLLIGLFFGPTVVGIYRLGLRLVEALVAALTRPVQAIGLPELAPHQDDLGELRRRVDRLARLAAVTTVPALGILAGVAMPAITLLGAEWEAAGVVAQALCVVGVVRAWVVIDGSLIVAVGSPFVQAASAWLAGLFSAAAFAVSGLFLQGLPLETQAFGIAVARASVWGLAIAGMHVWIMRHFARQTLPEMLAPVAWPAVAGICATGVGMLVDTAIVGQPAVLRLAAAGLASTAVAGGIVWWTVPAFASIARSFVDRRLRGRTGRRPSDPAAGRPGQGSDTADPEPVGGGRR